MKDNDLYLIVSIPSAASRSFFRGKLLPEL